VWRSIGGFVVIMLSIFALIAVLGMVGSFIFSGTGT